MSAGNGSRATGITVKDLINSNNYMKAIDVEFTNIIADIDSAIRKTNNMGLSHVSYDLPNRFNIASIIETDCAIVIYGRIIESYLERGFHTKINIKDTTTSGKTGVTLYIEWRHELDKAERERYLELIKANSMSNKKDT